MTSSSKKKSKLRRFWYFWVIILVLLASTSSLLYILLIKSQNSYRKIDFHQHIYSSANIQDYLKVMELFNVERAVMLSLRGIGDSSIYSRSNDFVLGLQQRYPDRIVAYTTIEEEDNNSLNVLKECVRRGARGLKLIGWHLKYIRKYGISLTDKNMYRLYGFCNKEEVPILIHLRLSHDERYYMDLEKILSDFKNLKIILAHGGMDLRNTWKLDRLLGKYPNLYFDLSFYGTYHEKWFRHVSKHRDEFRNLILKYSDQVLWGTDVFPSAKRGYDYLVDAMNCSISLVEKETFVCPAFKKEEELKGLYLPPRVLRKIYYKNALKLLDRTEPSKSKATGGKHSRLSLSIWERVREAEE